jgi:hypothetical protein
MISFGLITEGITDQEIISNILFGYFKNKDIPINPLQPIRDQTDKFRQGDFGGWQRVIEYCKSDYFKQAFQSCDFIIIQLDTDICDEFGVSKIADGIVLSPEILIERVIDYLITEIGRTFYEKVKDKLLFAISVHSIECWLLPLYYTDTRKGKITGCINTLNLQLNRKHGFFIDPDNKIFSIYQEISSPLKKNKTLKAILSHNPSLDVFIKELKTKNIRLEN